MENIPRWTIGTKTMSAFREIELGTEAMTFVTESLKLGETLSKLVLEVIDVKRGRVVTKLPSNVDEKAANDFKSGGKLPRLSSGITNPEPVPNTDFFIVETIRSFLDASSKNICIFEDASARATDPFTKSLVTRFATFGDEVYHWLCQSDDNDKILKTVQTARSWLFLGFMTNISEEPAACSENKPLKESELRRLALETKKIVVGAYDGEGYLIWSKE